MSYVGNKPAQTTIPADDAVTTAMLKDDAVTSAKIAGTTIVNADINASAGIALSKLASDPTYNDAGLQDDVALLGFKVASNGSLAKYNLVDQTVDDFQDTSGVDASASANELRNAAGKYYSGSSPASSTGTETTYGAYSLSTFTSTGTFTAGGSAAADILIVAGGGQGGGHEGGGGGGAGGFKYWSQTTVAAGENTVTVGAGGSSGTGAEKGAQGGISQFASLSSSTGGGGGGPHGGLSPDPDQDGGSGGGGTGRSDKPGGSGVANEGNDGGDATGSTGGSDDAGGGGGGASAAGGTASGTTAANGGAGYTEGATVYDWESGSGTVTFPSEFKVGSGGNLSYAGGGGGGSQTGSSGSGGTGGGGNADANGTANTGGGGGGNIGSLGSQGTGGSGIVIVRYITGAMDAYNNMTLISTTTAAQAAPTKGDIVFTYTNGAGSTTLGTDVTAEISADGGSTWTAMTLGSEGSTGSHNIATAHDVTITSTITSPWNMAYRIKTLNQAVGKTTRIQAVSLGWS